MGSVLETFLILFSSNADEVEKGAETAAKSVDKLEKNLKSSNVQTQKAGESFVKMSNQAAAALGSIISVGALIGGFFRAQTIANDLADISEVIGISVEELSLWGDAVSKSGGTAAAFQNTIQTMSSDFQQLATVGKSRLLPFFEQLGISVVDSSGRVRDVMDVLPQLAEAFGKLSKQEALGFGKKLGLDTGTIRLLQQGKEGVEAVLARQRELGVVTAQQAEVAKEYNDALDDVGHAYRTLSLRLARDLLPPLTGFYNLLQKVITYLAAHSDAVIYFIIALSAAMSGLAIKMAIALAPILAVISAFALFAVAAEDIRTFLNGGDSLTGRMVEWGKQFTALRAAAQLLVLMLTVLADVWDRLRGRELPNYSKGGPVDVTAGLARAQQQISFSQETPLASLSSASMQSGGLLRNNSNSIQIGEVNVNTQATDADGIAKSISGTLGTQMNQLQANFDDGIAY